MDESKNKPEPKKIKMPPLVDRSKMYDTMDWQGDDLWTKPNENHHENYSEGIQQLESESSD